MMWRSIRVRSLRSVVCAGQGREICDEMEEAERPDSGSRPFWWVRGGFSVSEAEGVLVV